VKLVVTGAGGGLGRAFIAQVPAHHEVRAFDHQELDVGDHDAVMRTIPPCEPDAIFHFAAFTDVDGCELDPSRADRDNAQGTRHVAIAARDCGAVLLHVSTDYVFDGAKGSPYDEHDEPAPLSVYGRSKLEAERSARELVREHVVVRTGYVFGAGDDYASRAIEALRRGEPAGGIRDRFGSPTFVHDLAARLLPLVVTGRFGTYHVAGPEPACWFDVLSRAKAIGGLPGAVQPQEAVALGRPAPRPANSSLTSVALGPAGIEPLPPLDDALERLLAARVG